MQRIAHVHPVVANESLLLFPIPLLGALRTPHSRSLCSNLRFAHPLCSTQDAAFSLGRGPFGIDCRGSLLLSETTGDTSRVSRFGESSSVFVESA